MQRIIPLVFSTLALVLSSCSLGPKRTAASGDAPPAPTAGGAPDTVFKLAQIESLRAEIAPADPSRATLTISGLLHDGATRVHDIQHQRLVDGFVVTVLTARPRTAVATLALIPFERTLTLDLTGMPKGPCRIVVNGVPTTLLIP